MSLPLTKDSSVEDQDLPETISLEHYLQLIQYTPAAILLPEEDGLKLRFWNKSFMEITGRAEEELNGLALRELIYPQGQEMFAQLEQVVNTGHPFFANEFPLSFISREAIKTGYYHVAVQPVPHPGTPGNALLMQIFDVTGEVNRRKTTDAGESNLKEMFNGMDQGFCIVEMVFDASGEPVDYIFRETNPVFESLTGITNAPGKAVTALVPKLEKHWFSIYGDVARTGKPVRFTEGSEAMGRWFEVNAFRIGGPESNRVAILFSNITKRKQSEEELQRNEHYFRQLTDTVPAIIWITRPDGFCTYLNRNWYAFTGQTKDEAEGYGWLNATHPDDAAEAGRRFMEATQKQEPFSLLYRLRHNSGTYRWAIDNGQPKFGADGSFEGMIGTVIDVHEQKLAEDKIRESEVRFRSLADASPVMIWTLDENGRSTYYNSRAREFTGSSEEDLEQGKTWQYFIHPDDIEYAAGVVKKAVEERKAYQMECRMRNAEGEWRWLQNQGIPRFGINGEFFGMVGSSMDITEQKTSREALQTALEQIRLSKEAAELGTFDMDLEKGTMHWDDRCRILFGISHHDPVTYEKDFATGLHPEDRERVLKLIDRLFIKSISNGDYDVEYRTVGAEDGIVRWVRAKGKVYFNEQDKPLRFIGSVLDITEKVMAIQQIEALVEERTRELAQANEVLERTNKELYRSNQNLEEFAHAASHDLKEPVRKIHFYTTRLKEQLSERLTVDEVHWFSRIEKSSERMRNLIDDLLLYSHVSQRPHEMEAIDLNLKLRNVIEDLELDIKEKNAVVLFRDLPVVRGHRRQLQQLFQNLVSNAIKYSTKGVAPEVSISSSITRENDVDYYQISVRDNGIGFDPGYSEKIFQMFTRLHGRGEYSGTGVGLSIVKKVVDNHNGFIRVESEVGKGSAFLIHLPV